MMTTLRIYWLILYYSVATWRMRRRIARERRLRMRLLEALAPVGHEDETGWHKGPSDHEAW